MNSGPITPDRRRAQPHRPPVLAARDLRQPIGIAQITRPGAAVLAHGLDEVEVPLIRFLRTPISSSDMSARVKENRRFERGV